MSSVTSPTHHQSLKLPAYTQRIAQAIVECISYELRTETGGITETERAPTRDKRGKANERPRPQSPYYRPKHTDHPACAARMHPPWFCSRVQLGYGQHSTPPKLKYPCHPQNSTPPRARVSMKHLASTNHGRKSSQVRNRSLGYMEQAPSRGHNSSPQGRLGLGWKLCSSSKKLRGLSLRAQARRMGVSRSFSIKYYGDFLVPVPPA